MNSRWMLVVAATLLLGACEGRYGNDRSPPESANDASPGGIFSAPNRFAELLFYVSERGDFRMHGYFQHDERDWLVGGAGMVGVNDRNRLIGNFVAQASWEFAANTFVEPETLSCELDGNVRERHSMFLTIECSSDDRVVWNELVEFVYAGHSYEYRPSSLEAIAGNYTLPAGPQTNTININSDGVVFGMFHLGLRCIVNGEVTLIDTRYNLYWMEWRFSSCSPARPGFEGAQYSGLAGLALPGAVEGREGGIFVLISGMTDDGFNYLSLLYGRV